MIIVYKDMVKLHEGQTNRQYTSCVFEIHVAYISTVSKQLMNGRWSVVICVVWYCAIYIGLLVVAAIDCSSIYSSDKSVVIINNLYIHVRNVSLPTILRSTTVTPIYKYFIRYAEK